MSGQWAQPATPAGYVNATSSAGEAQQGLVGVPFVSIWAWQSSTLSYVHLLADSSGNLLTSGSGGGGGSVTQGTVPWVVQAQMVQTPLAPATASVTNTDSVVIASNSSRKGLIVINIGSVNVFFGMGTSSALNSGIMLTPNGTWVMDPFTYYTGAIHAICSTSSTLSIQEYD